MASHFAPLIALLLAGRTAAAQLDRCPGGQSRALVDPSGASHRFCFFHAAGDADGQLRDAVSEEAFSASREGRLSQAVAAFLKPPPIPEYHGYGNPSWAYCARVGGAIVSMHPENDSAGGRPI